MMQDEAGGPGARLTALPTLPIFFKLAGKRALVAGGDLPTVWKSELLAATGAMVDVVAARPCSELRGLADANPSIRLIARDWEDGDFADAAIAIGSMASDDEAARFQQAAHRAGVPVNVIDKPAFCDFQFGTVVARSPLVLAITTDGAAPVLGQAIRTWLEALLPQGLQAWAAAAKAWRPRIEERAWSFRRRRRFWDAFARLALRPDAPPPDESAFQTCLSAATGDLDDRPRLITLVGCGSGAPDDLTFSAARTLQDADVVLHDLDVAPDTVALARREARKVYATSDEAAILQAGGEQLGTRIVWLGTGDPATCPHWAGRRSDLETTFSHISVERGLRTCPRCGDRCFGKPG